ncbi:MAG: sigma 54-interacting transcriptional regulator [Hungatella sp.]
MGKIVLLVSRDEMLYLAHNILQEKKYEIGEMRVIRTQDSVMEARNSIANGATIIIARGLQASLIKQYTDIPVVEIVLTAQEMAILIMKAKQIVKKPKPVIAVVGLRNMFCDMSYFDGIYDIELRMYYAESGDKLHEAAQQAAEEEADLIIGGDTAVEAATTRQIPSLFLSITEDSLKNAFAMAESMDYAMGVEKKNAAQMETILDYSFNGVMKIDASGLIRAVNPQIEDMLGQAAEHLTGRAVTEVFGDLDREMMQQVLEAGKEYSLLMQVQRTFVFAMIAPVMVDLRVDGAILTCHRMKKKSAGGANTEKKLRRDNQIAFARFEDLISGSKAMQECIRLAKLYSFSEKPVVILGEPGTEKEMLAQSIHNSSLQKEGPFLSLSCAGRSDAMQCEQIFGEKGAAAQADGGSLLIGEVDQLTCANQYRLYRFLHSRVCSGEETFPVRKSEARVMVTSLKPLAELVRQNEFREDLYYLLSGLVVRIPPLRERPEDLLQKLEECIRASCERYSRYHVLTSGAWKILQSYPWSGNLLQVESYCERLILTAGKRSVDEIMVKDLLWELYPEYEPQCRTEETWHYEPAEARKIAALLQKYNGSRAKTAAELGISKATLWRHMKKYEMKVK